MEGERELILMGQDYYRNLFENFTCRVIKLLQRVYRFLFCIFCVVFSVSLGRNRFFLKFYNRRIVVSFFEVVMMKINFLNYYIAKKIRVITEFISFVLDYVNKCKEYLFSYLQKCKEYLFSYLQKDKKEEDSSHKQSFEELEENFLFIYGKRKLTYTFEILKIEEGECRIYFYLLFFVIYAFFLSFPTVFLYGVSVFLSNLDEEIILALSFFCFFIFLYYFVFRSISYYFCVELSKVRYYFIEILNFYRIVLMYFRSFFLVFVGFINNFVYLMLSRFFWWFLSFLYYFESLCFFCFFKYINCGFKNLFDLEFELIGFFSRSLVKDLVVDGNIKNKLMRNYLDNYYRFLFYLSNTMIIGGSDSFNFLLFRNNWFGYLYSLWSCLYGKGDSCVLMRYGLMKHFYVSGIFDSVFFDFDDELLVKNIFFLIFFFEIVGGDYLLDEFLCRFLFFFVFYEYVGLYLVCNRWANSLSNVDKLNIKLFSETDGWFF